MTVENEWDCQKLGQLINAPLGQSIRKSLMQKVPELLAENAKMREALEKLRDCDWVITLPDRMDGVREIARNALS